MKLTILLFALLLSLATLAQTNSNNLATVPQYSGVYVFAFSNPVKEYTYIATIKKTVVANTTGEALQKYAAMAKKEHPDCDGIILHDIQNGFSKDNIEVIKFK